MIDLSLLNDFLSETAEHLEEMESSLLKLETDPANKEILNDIFRAAHTIKGSSEYLGMEKIAAVSHRLENLLEIIRHEDHRLDREIIETLIDARDRIARLMTDLEEKQTEKTDISDIITRMDSLSEKADGRPGEDIKTKSQSAKGTVETKDKNDARSPLSGIYEQLKAGLYDITRNEVNESNKKKVADLFHDLIEIVGSMGETGLGEALSGLREETYNLTFPEDAGDILAELHRLVSLLPSGDEIVEPENPAKLSGDAHTEIIAETVDGEQEDETELTYEEEYDDELFDIFIHHLKENLTEIWKLITGSEKDENPEQMLDKSLNLLNNLYSSANYMDYKRLTKVYDDWIHKINETRENLTEETELSRDFMGTYLNRVIEFFPKRVELNELFIEEKKPQKLTEQPLFTNEELFGKHFVPVSEKEETGETMEESPLLLDEEPDVIQPSGEADESETGELIDYSGLFEELDNAFESFSAQYETAKIPEEKEGVKNEQASAPKSEESMGQTPVPDEAETKGQAADGERVREKTEPEAIGEDSRETTVTPAPEKPPTGETASEKPAKPTPGEPVSERGGRQTLRVDTGKIDDLMNQVGELVVNRAWFSQLFNEMKELQDYLQHELKLGQREMKPVRSMTFRISEATVALGRVANELQEGVMKVRMLPVSQLFNRYPRLVRDLTHGTDKSVRLEIVGEETELDKMVIEEIADPLVHIIRNAVDHGCETVAERKKKGKPPECRLRLESYHESNNVVIEISDDGRGIDFDLIKETATEKGVYTREELERMTRKEVLNIIMRPGFSTKKQVSKTSGRGVGMDVVRQNIERANGTLDIESEKDLGTRTRIKIPLTLAIIQALLVRVGDEIFTIPLASVEETLRVFEEEITIIEGVEVFHLREASLSLLRLSEIFNLTSEAERGGKSFVVVVNTGVRRVGLVVDALIGQEEVVIKPMVDYLQEKSGFSGATILGDGKISLILDIYELINISIGQKMRRRDFIAKIKRKEKEDYRKSKTMSLAANI